MTELRRRLGLWDGLALLVGIVVGSGIFRSAGTAAQGVSTGAELLLLWVAGGAIALLGALSYAELASTYPRAGAQYVFIRQGWGSLPAFLFGWVSLLIIKPAVLGALSVALGEFAAPLLARVPGVHDALHAIAGVFGSDHLAGEARVIGGTALVTLTLVNVVGVRIGTTVHQIVTWAKVAALAMVTGALLAGGGGSAPPVPADEVGPAGLATAGIVLAIEAVLWAYDGWNDVSYVAGEIERPERTLVRIFVGGTLAVVVLYVLVNAGYLNALGVSGMARAQTIATDAVTATVGPGLGDVVSGLICLSIFGTLSGSVLTGARLYYAIGADGTFLRVVARVHSRFSTPAVALVAQGSLGLALALSGTFEHLMSAFVFFSWTFYAAAVAAIFPLRRREPHRPRPFRVPGYPWVPAAFVAASLTYVVKTLADDIARVPEAETIWELRRLIGLALLLAGVPVFLLWRRFSERRKRAT